MLYELAHREDPAAKEIGTELRLDAGYLSRIVQNFDENGLITRKPLPSDRRQYRLALTAKGRQAFAKLERSSQDDVAAMLAALSRGASRRLIGAMAEIERLLGDASVRPRPGDPARATGPATWAGWCRATARSMPANTASIPLRGAGRGDRGKIPDLVRCLARALLDRRNRRRAGRLGISGAPYRRSRQAATAAGRSGRARTGTRPAAGRRVHRVRAAVRLVVREQGSKRLSWSLFFGFGGV